MIPICLPWWRNDEQDHQNQLPFAKRSWVDATGEELEGIDLCSPPMVMGQGLDTTTTSHQHPLKIHDFVAMNGQAKEITCVLTGKTLFISVCAAKQVTQNCETLTEKKKHQKERQKIKCTSELGPQVVSLWRCQGMSNTLSNGRHFGWHCWWH